VMSRPLLADPFVPGGRALDAPARSSRRRFGSSC
jgi:hypothetical protein